MYEAYYGLRERPFSLAPDPAYLYLARHHRRALAMLEYALLHGAGFALVTGEVGSGKTTLIRRVLATDAASMTVGLLTNTHPEAGAQLPWIAQSLGLEAQGASRAGLYDAFVRFLLDEYAAGRRVVLVVDEAQNLPAAALEELRVLSNINVGRDLLLQTILVGQPELRATLRQPCLRQFAQRIAVDYHIGTLSSEETRAYVRHRVAVAGGEPGLFLDEALDLVHAASGGVPRVVNLLCDTALVYGFADEVPRIGRDLVDAVVRDRSEGGLLAAPGIETPALAP